MTYGKTHDFPAFYSARSGFKVRPIHLPEMHPNTSIKESLAG